MELIALSEEKAPDGVIGTFQFKIKASGIKGGVIYLNTEMDYRDRRNITVVIHPKIIDAFTKQFGSSPNLFFINKTIKVSGEAKRVRIDFISNGKRSNKYYFQTHLLISSLKQIKVLS